MPRLRLSSASDGVGSIGLPIVATSPGRSGRILLPLALGLPVLVVLAYAIHPAVADYTHLGNGLFAYAGVLLAAVLVAYRWALSRWDADAWLVLALLFIGAQGFGRCLLWTISPEASAMHGGSLAVLDLSITAGSALSAAAVGQTRFPGDPLRTGALFVVVLVGLRLLATYVLPEGPSSPTAIGALAVMVLLTHAALAGLVLTRSGAPRWIRLRLAGALALLGLAQSASVAVAGDRRGELDGAPSDPGAGLMGTLAFAADLGLALMLITTALAVLRMAMRDERASRAGLEVRLDEVAAVERAGREKMHEIGSTLAGIASASELIGSTGPIEERRRALLAQMMHAELARLQRLMHAPAAPSAVDLDEALRHVVESHRARGTAVAWAPSELSVQGRSDAITEVVNILLDNAVHHGAGAPEATRIDLEVVTDDHTAQIRVTDHGGGIDAAVRPHIFERGVSRADSPGQGLGLHIAAELMRDQGGSLRLVDSSARGTTFVVTLPLTATATSTLTVAPGESVDDVRTQPA